MTQASRWSSPASDISDTDGAVLQEAVCEKAALDSDLAAAAIPPGLSPIMGGPRSPTLLRTSSCSPWQSRRRRHASIPKYLGPPRERTPPASCRQRGVSQCDAGAVVGRGHRGDGRRPKADRLHGHVARFFVAYAADAVHLSCA